MPRALNRVLLLVTALGGCSLTASLGGDTEEGSTGSDMAGTSGAVSSSSGAANGSGTSGAGTEVGSTGAVGTTSTAVGTTTDASSSSAGSEDTSTGPEPLVCQGPGDASCLSCLRDSCCGVLEQCLTTPLCSCLLGCLEFAPNFVSCLNNPVCGGGPAASELQTCAAVGCGPACGL